MKSDPRKIQARTVLHAQAAPLSGTVSGTTYEHESVSSDGRVLVRVKQAGGKPDFFRWTTQEELTD